MQINSNKKCSKYKDLIMSTFSVAQEKLCLPSNVEVNVAIVSCCKIKKLNRIFRNTNKVTDVLSFPTLLPPEQVGMGVITEKLTPDNFPQDINPETNNIVLGDIYICLNRVKKQGKEFGHGFERELCYLSLHGLLHLLGYDHMTTEDKREMRKMEELILPQGK